MTMCDETTASTSAGTFGRALRNGKNTGNLLVGVERRALLVKTIARMCRGRRFYARRTHPADGQLLALIADCVTHFSTSPIEAADATPTADTRLFDSIGRSSRRMPTPCAQTSTRRSTGT